MLTFESLSNSIGGIALGKVQSSLFNSKVYFKFEVWYNFLSTIKVHLFVEYKKSEMGPGSFVRAVYNVMCYNELENE